MLKTSEMAQKPPDGCPFKVGDIVSFTNDYGVKFSPHKVVGFTLPGDEFHGHCVYIDYDCYWFPAKPESLKLLEN